MQTGMRQPNQVQLPPPIQNQQQQQVLMQNQQQPQQQNVQGMNQPNVVLQQQQQQPMQTHVQLQQVIPQQGQTPQMMPQQGQTPQMIVNPQQQQGIRPGFGPQGVNQVVNSLNQGEKLAVRFVFFLVFNLIVVMKFERIAEKSIRF